VTGHAPEPRLTRPRTSVGQPQPSKNPGREGSKPYAPAYLPPRAPPPTPPPRVPGAAPRHGALPTVVISPFPKYVASRSTKGIYPPLRQARRRNRHPHSHLASPNSHVQQPFPSLNFTTVPLILRYFPHSHYRLCIPDKLLIVPSRDNFGSQEPDTNRMSVKQRLSDPNPASVIRKRRLAVPHHLPVDLDRPRPPGDRPCLI
jgi:hypothetical protein